MPPDFDAIYRPEDYPSDPYNLMNYFRPPLDRFGPRDIRGINEGGTSPVWVDRWGGGNSSARLGAPARSDVSASAPSEPTRLIPASGELQPSFQPGTPSPALQPMLPDTSGITSARQRMMEIYGQQPKREDYRPGFWRTLGSAAAGGATAFAGGGRPQSVEEGMNIVRGGLDEPYNRAMSVWQPKMQAAQTGLQAAEQDYQLGRQRTMDESTLEDRAAQAKFRDAEAARQNRLAGQLVTPQERQDYLNQHPEVASKMDDEDKNAFVLFNRPPKTQQERSKTKEQLYYEAGERDAQGNPTPNAQRARQTLDAQLADEQKLARSRRDVTGELTPAQIAREKNRLQDEYQKRLDSVEKLIREGEKTGQRDRRGQEITRKYDANDPQIIEMKQRAQDDYERGLENIGQTPKRVTYQAGQPAPTPQGQQAWSKSAWAKANPGKDANAAETAARQQKLNVVP